MPPLRICDHKVKRGALLLVLLVAALIAGCSDRLEGKHGEELYRVGCAQCHGADLTGGLGPPIDAGSNADIGLSDEQVVDVIRVGPGAMPGFDRRLTEEQIESLVVYLRVRHGR
ncbi:MAG: cytochrome c [Acidobacteria bacterium]|nr:cytochrome c [Acidobacteriota bacterium]